MLEKLKYIIFDLDGTLLPMDQDEFLKYYFKFLSQSFSEFESKQLIDSIQYAVFAMLNNDGKKTNEEVFWLNFAKVFPVYDGIEKDFEAFYRCQFQELQKFTPSDANVKKIINILKTKGYKLICCTNPLFPKLATYSRIKWAGLDVSDFLEITTYENSSFCKPKLEYYEEVLKRFNIDPQTCLMVGNDVDEDLCTKDLEMMTFLVTNHVINKNNKPIISDYIGTRKELLSFVNKLAKLSE